MKNKKDFIDRTRIVTLAVVCAITLFCSIIFTFAHGTDCTKEYLLYANVEDYTSTYALMDYCHANGISYSINNNKFSLQGYSTSFSLVQEKCSVNNNRHMNNFFLLASGRYDIINTEKNADGTTIRSYMIKTLGTNYELKDGTFIMYNTLPALIFAVVSAVFAILLCMCLYLNATCKHCHYRTQN